MSLHNRGCSSQNRARPPRLPPQQRSNNRGWPPRDSRRSRRATTEGGPRDSTATAETQQQRVAPATSAAAEEQQQRVAPTNPTASEDNTAKQVRFDVPRVSKKVRFDIPCNPYRSGHYTPPPYCMPRPTTKSRYRLTAVPTDDVVPPSKKSVSKKLYWRKSARPANPHGRQDSKVPWQGPSLQKQPSELPN